MRWLFVLIGMIWFACATVLSQPWLEPSSVKTVEYLTLYVPAAPGGGYDRTALAMRRALLAEGLVGSVDITYSPGAGGLIGLAQFIESQAGNPNALLICGRTALGAALHNRSAVVLRDATPIAGLVAPMHTLIVPAKSSLKDFADIAEILREDPHLLTWYGGSAGSYDEIIVQSVSQTFAPTGEPTQFEAIPGGGDAIIDKLFEKDFAIAVSSYEEVSDSVAAGRVRILAVSGSQVSGKIQAPTLQQLGVPIQTQDWRAVFAAPNLSVDEARALSSLIKNMVDSPSWRTEQTSKLWQNIYMGPAALSELIETDWLAVQAASINQTSGIEQSAQADTILGRRKRWTQLATAMIVFLGAAVIILFLFIRRQRQRMAETADEFSDQTRRLQDQLDKSQIDMVVHINSEFDSWKLTRTENEIGWMLLKGMSFKEIAGARGRSERTVRQQAQSIYAKSKLQSRSDLAAYFLEDFVFGYSDPGPVQD